MIVSRAILAAALAASSAMAHSNMFFPVPRKDASNAFVNRDNNACESTSTDIPAQNTFQRGQTIPLKCKSTRQFTIDKILDFALGWWNNHEGGFIKMAILQGVSPAFDRKGQEAFLARENSTSSETPFAPALTLIESPFVLQSSKANATRATATVLLAATQATPRSARAVT